MPFLHFNYYYIIKKKYFQFSFGMSKKNIVFLIYFNYDISGFVSTLLR